MSIDLSTFWTTWGVYSGDTSSTNQYDFWRGMIMDDDTQLSSQFDFFTYNNTTRYQFFKNLNNTYPEVWDETTFYQNTNDARIFDYNTFYTYAAESLPGGVTPGPMNASGGTVTQITEGSTTYNVHTFTSSGTFTVNSLGTSTGQVEYLVLGGGGGGGSAHGGGGGAGGFLTGSTNLSVQAYTVTVGAGGAGGSTSTLSRGSTGSNSVFATLTAYGGGGGGAYDGCSNNPAICNGGDGGSGGGAGGGGSVAGSTGGSELYSQGFDGGNNGEGCPQNGRGGGGAGQVGADDDFDATQGAKGGDGLQSSINGTATYYGGGGGAGVWRNFRPVGGPGGLGGGGKGGDPDARGSNGTANRGAGGGGGGDGQPGGGNGGSGIVIVRYPVF